MLLGLDLGTTNVKALLADGDRGVIADAASPVAVEHVDDGGVEQDIEDIWQATLKSIIALGAEHDLSAVRAVGVSSQGGAMQVTDAHGTPVGPVCSWLDARGREFDRRLQAEVGREWLVEHNGHGRSGTAVGQLLRLREQDPEMLAGERRVGFVGDIITRRLCGRWAHDATSLSLCFLYNPRADDYDDELLERVGLDRGRLPELLPATEPAGGLLDKVAAETGLPANIPVSPAIHDQYAAALGCGAVRAGDVMFGAGTAWVLLAVTDALADPAAGAAFVCRHVVEGLYGQMLSLNTGGSALSWVLRTLRLSKLEPEKLDELIDSAPAACEGLRCWPFLAFSGTGLHHGTGGRLENLRLSHTPGHVVRATVEGLACELNRHVHLMRDAGVDVRRLVMCGRAAGSRVTPRIIADTTELPIDRGADSENSALGAAVLAARLADTGTDLADLSLRFAPAAETIHPGEAADTYHALYRQYVASLPKV